MSRREQHSAPYLDALASYAFRDPTRFHVPGHKGGPGADPAVHGDEAIPANFLAGFEGIPSLTERQTTLFKLFSDTLEQVSPDFQTAKGYEVPAPGQANMSMSTTQLAERFGCVSMTLEMPFKDNVDLPDPVHGWSPDRCRHLASACLDALHAVIDKLAAYRGG